MASSPFVRRQLQRTRRKVRTVFNRDRIYTVGGKQLALPPEHLLPEYQAAFPKYDRYFLSFLQHLAQLGTPISLIDIGANVGDTSAAFLVEIPQARAICIEGNDRYIPYLRRNLKPFSTVTIVDALVLHEPGEWSWITQDGTGRLVPSEGTTSEQTRKARISPSQVLALAGPGDLTIWKSDTDGFDIPILLSSFDTISSQCEIIWIEFDPSLNTSGSEDVSSLLESIASLDRDVVVFDNFGNLMFRLPAASGAQILTQLSWWLESAGVNGGSTNYLDIWVLPRNLAVVLESFNRADALGQ